MTERVPTEPQRFEVDARPGRTTAGKPAWGGVRRTLRDLARRLAATTSDRVLVLEWLALILVLGAVLRFTGLDWDQGQHLHPDERFLTMVENSLQWPESLGQYLSLIHISEPTRPY